MRKNEQKELLLRGKPMLRTGRIVFANANVTLSYQHHHFIFSVRDESEGQNFEVVLNKKCLRQTNFPRR